MAKLIQVIETDVCKGKGVEGDPIRTVIQYWSTDGILLAEHDAWTLEQLKNAKDSS